MAIKTLSLLELNRMIREVVETNFSDTFLVTAEISELKVNARGHCYLELIEKAPDSDQPAARARAMIWAYTFRILKPYFETTTGQSLTAGIKVLVEAEVTFHEVYGLSLNIKDIDPAYTLGEMAVKRKEIIERLRREGILEMNKQLPFPLVPQRIAIISSETAAGYQDFVHQLLNHPGRYHFSLELFPAMMQGKEAEDTIVAALETIYTREKDFDLVTIIRGGGSQADLSSFDNYRLAQHIAQFPLPVLTGIGHEKDETVADLVAFAGLKTPTAVAEFILERVSNFEEKLLSLAAGISYRTKETLTVYHQTLKDLGWQLKEKVQNGLVSQHRKLDGILGKTVYLTKNLLGKEENKLRQHRLMLKKNKEIFMPRYRQSLSRYKLTLKNISRQTLTRHDHRLELIRQSIHLLDPGRILKRGFSITLLNGKALKNSKKVKNGDILHTRLYKGTVTSKVSK